MRGFARWARIALAVALGLAAIAAGAAGLSTVWAAGRDSATVEPDVPAHVDTSMSLAQFTPVTEAMPDLTLDVNVPTHVAAGSDLTIRIAYYNKDIGLAPDAWITATLPTGTQFVTATDRWGTPLPPTATDGNQLTWYVVGLSCYTPLDGNCGHILITATVDENLKEGTEMAVSASIATSVAESDTTNNTDVATVTVCDMAGSAKQVHAGEGMPGDVLTYTLVVDLARRSGNQGQAQERWVTLTDTLPFSHQVRFLGWTSAVTGTHDGQMLRWQGLVRAGEPLTLQYRLGVEGVVTPGTVLTNLAQLRWMSGTMQLGPVTTVVTLSHYAHMIGPTGDEWRHEYGVTLTVPPGAVAEMTRFQFQPLTGTQPISGPPGLVYAHRAFEITAFRFGQDVHQFGQPLTITLRYDNADVAGLKRETLRLWYRSSLGEPWAMLGEPARVMSGTQVYTTTHLTQFALFGEAAHRVFLPMVKR